MIESCKSSLNDFERLGFLAHTNDLAGLHAVRGNVNHIAVDDDVTMRDQLACCCSCGGNTEAEHDPKEKSPSGFSVGAGFGYNFTDNIAMFFRYKKGFGDIFNSVGVMPLECKETAGILEMGITFGLTM